MDLIITTADANGNPPECIYCSEAIPIGSSAAVNRNNEPTFHPECHGPFLRSGRPGMRPQGERTGPAGTSVGAGRDLGDAVADEIDRQLGRTPSAAARSNSASGSPGRCDDYLAQCEALGPRDPITGLRPTQDVGDATAERVLEMRKGNS